MRYWHTLRHLRPVQLYGRLWFRLHQARPQPGPAPAIRHRSGHWQMPARRSPSLLGARHFVFLSEHGLLDEVGWDGLEREKLWRYNQHYFDDLNAEGSDVRTAWHIALLTDWVAENPPNLGTGWEPYPTSLRIVNWIKWSLAGHALPSACIQSLAIQARCLSQRLEIHLLGNHLFANAKALVFAGLFFNGAEAQKWLRIGLRIIAQEIPEQILSDGGHFERSTMYHALMLEDMLDLVNLTECYRISLPDNDQIPVQMWRERARAMLGWLNAMRHPDGEIGFFNDAALGIAPGCEELVAYSTQLGICPEEESGPSRWLAESGYVRLSVPEALALLDLARVGPDYLPGHAHADTLSFELSVGKHRLLVNSGTSCYGMSDERLRQRGTASHNTVVIDGQDSSEVWSGFRVARRAYPLSPKVNLESLPITAECGHDGYTRLPGRPIHRRRWQMSEKHFCIEDFVSGCHGSAQARFHFHPDVRVTHTPDPAHGHAELPNGQLVEWRVEQGLARMLPSTWHPRFGLNMANQCLCIDLVQGKSKVQFIWH